MPFIMETHRISQNTAALLVTRLGQIIVLTLFIKWFSLILDQANKLVRLPPPQNTNTRHSAEWNAPQCISYAMFHQQECREMISAAIEVFLFNYFIKTSAWKSLANWANFIMSIFPSFHLPLKKLQLNPSEAPYIQLVKTLQPNLFLSWWVIQLIPFKKAP